MVCRAINSVLGQTETDFELLVVDDGSTEDYEAALWAIRDPRVTKLRNATNLGVSQARNTGIEHARGQYISFLDDDDEYLPTFLTDTSRRLRDAPPECAVTWCGIKSFEDDLGTENPTASRSFLDEYPSRTVLFEQFLSIGSGFGVTAKADAIRKIGAFNTELRVVEDADLFLRFLTAGYMPAVVPGIHVVVHNHKHHRLTDKAMHPQRIEECEWLVERHSEFLVEFPSLQRQLLRRIEELTLEMSELEFKIA
jgi:glycosyltransferase involved in cell wall biosynthesis